MNPLTNHAGSPEVNRARRDLPPAHVEETPPLADHPSPTDVAIMPGQSASGSSSLRLDKLTLARPSHPADRPGTAGLERDPALGARLAELMHRYGLANAGATIIDLKSGTFAGFGENRPLSPASVIKVPLMVEVMKQVEGGQLALDQMLPITRSNWTESEQNVLKIGDRRTVEQLVNLMITKSDNVATNTLIDAVGRHHVNRTMAELGIPELRLVRKLSGETRVERDVTARNQSTARSTAELLTLLERGQLVSPEASRRMKDWMRRNEDDTLVQRGLDEAGLLGKARLYNKSGGHSKALNDAGIIEVGDRRYVLTLFTPQDGSKKNPVAEGRLAGVTRDLLRYLEERHARQDAPDATEVASS